MKFTKMHGLGNDYVYVNGFEEGVDDPVTTARAVADRFTGIGSDGLILIRPSSAADVRMEMYNADGSRGAMCGNGIRCVAKYAVEHGLAGGPVVRIETDAGVRSAECRLDGTTVTSVRVDMGPPEFAASALPSTLLAKRLVNHRLRVGRQDFTITCVSIGNPHAVIFVEDPQSVDLATVGPMIEHAPEFPQRINAHFAHVESPDRVRVRTWERGSGATRACGTGACAVAVAAAVTGRAGRSMTTCLPGGELFVEWAGDEHVYMTGPAVEVFHGVWLG